MLSSDYSTLLNIRTLTLKLSCLPPSPATTPDTFAKKSEAHEQICSRLRKEREALCVPHSPSGAMCDCASSPAKIVRQHIAVAPETSEIDPYPKPCREARHRINSQTNTPTRQCETESQQPTGQGQSCATAYPGPYAGCNRLRVATGQQRPSNRNLRSRRLIQLPPP